MARENKNTGSTVEAYGYENTICLYNLHTEAKTAPYFAIFQGSVIKYPYTTDDDGGALQCFINNFRALEQSGTQGLYTIRFYNDLDANDDITTNTPFRSSFNFKVFKSEYTGGQVTGVSNSGIDTIVQMLKQQEERLRALEDGSLDEEIEEVTAEDEANDIIGQVTRVTNAIENNPTLSGMFEDIRFGLRHLMRKAGVSFEGQRSQPVGNVNRTNTNNMSDTNTADAATMLREALKQLLPVWPELPGILHKLASVSITSPEDFNFYKKKLNEKVNEI